MGILQIRRIEVTSAGVRSSEVLSSGWDEQFAANALSDMTQRAQREFEARSANPEVASGAHELSLTKSLRIVILHERCTHPTRCDLERIAYRLEPVGTR